MIDHTQRKTHGSAILNILNVPCQPQHVVAIQEQKMMLLGQNTASMMQVNVPSWTLSA